jgi:trimeric autotransporter adhesin
MSQIVQVSGDYGIKVDEGSTITLDTGNQVGDVVITGKLVVKGETVTIETTELSISDKLIYLNVGEIGPGITDNISGIEIERGRFNDSTKVPNARILFDESITWYNPITDSEESGSWILIDKEFELQPIRVASLSASALTDFVIDLRNGTNVLRLTNSDAQAYSDRINNDLDSASNIIPNIRTLQDFVSAGNVTPGMADVDKIYYSEDSGDTLLSVVQSKSTSIDFTISDSLSAQLTAGGFDLYGDINIRGLGNVVSNLVTTSDTFNLVNTNSSTINFGGAASVITIGSTSGSTRFKHSIDVDGDVNIDGGDLTVSTGTFNLANTNVLTLNLAGSATNINIGSATGTTNVNNDLNIGGNDLTVETSIFNLANTTATTINFAGEATLIDIGSLIGITRINNNLDVTGDVNIAGGDLTSNVTVFSLLNTGVSTIKFGGNATTVEIGNLSGFTTVNNNLIVNGNISANGGEINSNVTSFSLLDTFVTTLTFASAATDIEIGAATGTTNINNDLDVDGDVNVDGGNLTVSTTTFNLANTTATTVNFAGDATLIEIGSATGTTNINNDLDVDGDVNVDGGNLTVSTTTFNLANTTATTVNFAGDATLIEIGSATGTTNVNNNLDVDGDVNVDGGNLTVSTTTFNLANTTATTLNIGGDATTVEIGAATGTTNVNNNLDVDGDVNVDGSNLTVSTTTFNLANTTATTLNIGGDATTVEIGAATGTTNINNDLDVDGDVNIDGSNLTVSTTTFNLANTTATTVNFAGDATLIEIGAATGTTNINNDLDVDGDINIDGGNLTVSTTTFNLANITATTLNIGGDATTVEIGSATGLTTINHDVDIKGNLVVYGYDDSTAGSIETDALQFNLLNTTATAVNFAGAATSIEIGSATGTTNVNNNLDVDGDLNVDGGNLTVSTTTFNLANTTATTLNIGGDATVVEIGAATGTTTINNDVDIKGNIFVYGYDDSTGGSIETDALQFNLLNDSVTTLNIGGDATAIEIGSALGTTTINNDVGINGNLFVYGHDDSTGGSFETDALQFNLLNDSVTTVFFAGDATAIEIGAATGTTTINHDVDIKGNLFVYGYDDSTVGSIETDALQFNLLNDTSTDINFGGNAFNINIGTTTGSTTINDINITGNVISSVSADDLLFDGVLALSNQVSIPSPQAGYVKVYSTDTPGAAGTGLYFVNTIGTNDELISKTKAFLFSLIL